MIDWEQIKKIGFSLKSSSEKKYAGIEIFQIDETYRYNLVLLKNNQGNVEILDRIKNISSIADIQKVISSDTPVHLVYSAKGVIYKKLPESFTQNFSELFPQFNSEDFYRQKHDVFLSVTRKVTLLKTIDSFREFGLIIQNITVGSFDLKYIHPLIKSNSISTSSGIFSFVGEGMLTEIKTDINQPEANYQLDGENISGRLLPAYAAALRGILSQGKNSSDILEVSESYEEHIRKKKLIGRLKIAIPVFLLLFVLNYAAHSLVNEKNAAIKIQSKVYYDIKAETDSLRALAKERTVLFSKLNITGGAKTSFWADRIASTIPKDINLLEMVIFPPKNSKRKNYYPDEEINQIQEYNAEIVRLKGTSSSAEVYSTWIENLKLYEWVSDVEHFNYELNREGKGDFEILITVL